MKKRLKFGRDMKIVIESAKPELSEKLSAKNIEYYVLHWNVTGYFWDGNCMCTKKDFNYKIDWPFLDCSRSNMQNMIKQKAG